MTGAEAGSSPSDALAVPSSASEPSAGVTGGLWAPGTRRLTAALGLNVTVVALESLSVATVMPVVSRHLGDLRLYGWVFSSFFLASLLGIVVAGWTTDRRGLRAPLLGGLLLFGAGLVVAGLAPDMPVLVAGRAIQGLGAGCVPSAAYVAIGRAYVPHERPRMFAILSSAWVLPGLVGPALAAQVAAHAGWRWVFLGLIPPTLAVCALTLPALALVPAPEPGFGTRTDERSPFLPAVLVTAGAAVLLIAMSTAGTGARIVVAALVATVGAAVLIPALGRLTPAGTLWARRGPPAAVLTRGLLTFSFFSGDAYVPLTLTSVRHTSTTYAGLTLTVATLAWAGASWLQARAISRTGPRVLIRSGLVLVLTGLAGMGALLAPSVPVWLAPLAWGVGGFGIGLAYAPISLTALGWAPRGQEGKASSALQLTDVLGSALGTGAAGAAVAVLHEHGGHRFGLGVAFSLAAGAATLAISISGRLPGSTAP